MRGASFQFLGLIGLLSWTTPSFAYTCAINGEGKDLKDIAKSCESLMDTMDATDIKLRAFNQCCESANAYLKKNPIPCSDKAKARYRIRLGLAVCDTIKDPVLDYEHQYCVNQMLYRIPDEKVLEIADKCSPSGGRSAKGKKGLKDTEAKNTDKSSLDKTTEKPVDLHMDDEDFSKCQRAKLAKYLEKLDQEVTLEIKRDPANKTDCSANKP